MTARAPLPCPACGTPMNRHAEKLVASTAATDLAAGDAPLGDVLMEFHQCPNCGRIESLRVVQ